MKAIFLSTLIFLSIFSFAQIQDLSSLAAGDFVGFNAIFDTDEKLFGYIAIYNKGKQSETTNSFEYVLLDRNLNEVANNSFEGESLVWTYYGYMNFKGQIVLAPRIDYSTKYRILKNSKQPKNKIIDLKENVIHNKEKYCYENNQFAECPPEGTFKETQKDEKAEMKKNGFVHQTHLTEYKYGGYVLSEYKEYKKYISHNKVTRFDDDRNILWEYKYNESADKKNAEFLNVIELDEDFMYAILVNRKNKSYAYELLILDMKTGKEVKREHITQFSDETLNLFAQLDSQEGSLENVKSFDDKIVILSKQYDQLYNELGFVRTIINKSDLSHSFEFFGWLDLSAFLSKINRLGIVEKNYRLKIRDAFFLKDGSISILFEKFKPAGYYSNPKTTDLVYVYTDKDFNVTGAKVLEKEKTKGALTDYLFSQYLNDGDDIVFFYRDYQKDKDTKEKKWNLFINTLIEGEFNQEVIPISSEENFISPYVAKEGYILLREFNKKKKFNQIRLERLNY